MSTPPSVIKAQLLRQVCPRGKKVKAQLKIGIPIEMEHTRQRSTARQIACHHLLELPDYYTRLVRMERARKRGRG